MSGPGTWGNLERDKCGSWLSKVGRILPWRTQETRWRYVSRRSGDNSDEHTERVERLSVLCLRKDFHQVLSWSFHTHFAGALSEGKVHYPGNKAPIAHLPLWCALILACVVPCQWVTAYSTLACPWSLYSSLQRKAQQVDRTTDIWERSRCTHWPRRRIKKTILANLTGYGYWMCLLYIQALKMTKGWIWQKPQRT